MVIFKQCNIEVLMKYMDLDTVMLFIANIRYVSD